MNTDTLFSSDRNDWRTPPDLYVALSNEFAFEIDVAADAENHLAPDYIDEAKDALSFDWGIGTTAAFCNPPYGKQLGDWVRHCRLQSLLGATVVMLIPARTDTRFWHDYVMEADEIRLIRGRVSFLLPDGGKSTTAPFPSAVVVFRPNTTRPTWVRSWHWRETEVKRI